MAKNGILIIEFANIIRRDQGADTDTAIRDAAETRLRPGSRHHERRTRFQLVMMLPLRRRQQL
ncbi:MAG: hypothetical protein IKE66_01590 [Hyphomicrobium sp.]|nr:hypothetical protein [Hyphomicrobium sp.]